MTTVLSVTTTPIVWPKKRASAASGTIIKEQEWAVHIKQHNIPRRPTCIGTMKAGGWGGWGRRESGFKRSGRERGSGTEKRADDMKKAQKEAEGEITVKQKWCFVPLKR